MSIIQCASSEMTTTHILSIVYVIPLDAIKRENQTEHCFLLDYYIVSPPVEAQRPKIWMKSYLK